MAEIDLGFNKKPTEVKTFWVDATGDWQPVFLPDGIECSVVVISSHDGDESNFDHADGDNEFHLSSNSDGSEWVCVNPGIQIPVTKTQEPICYVKAKNNTRKIAITLLKVKHES